MTATQTTSVVLCRHCEIRPVNRPRGLCWTDYYAPGVKELYPSTSKYARRGVGNFAGCAPLPPKPTTAAPGTPEKIAVLRQRAELGLQLHHPHDLAYAPQSDTDGGSIGTDHFVCDEHGAEVCLARDEASGRLFAAAPDLLAACEVSLNGGGSAGEWERTRDVIRAAVAKAKGGA